MIIFGGEKIGASKLNQNQCILHKFFLNEIHPTIRLCHSLLGWRFFLTDLQTLPGNVFLEKNKVVYFMAQQGKNGLP